MDEDKRKELVRAQAVLSGGWVSFPFDARCSRCGYDFLGHPKKESIISGCPSCGKSYCE